MGNWGAVTFKTFKCEFAVSPDSFGGSLCEELGQAVPLKVPLWRQGGGHSEMSLQNPVPGAWAERGRPALPAWPARVRILRNATTSFCGFCPAPARSGNVPLLCRQDFSRTSGACPVSGRGARGEVGSPSPHGNDSTPRPACSARAPNALPAGPWTVRPGGEPPDPRRTAGDRLRCCARILMGRRAGGAPASDARSPGLGRALVSSWKPASPGRQVLLGPAEVARSAQAPFGLSFEEAAGL